MTNDFRKFWCLHFPPCTNLNVTRKQDLVSFNEALSGVEKFILNSTTLIFSIFDSEDITSDGPSGCLMRVT